jgi:3-(3-hydroxy-phenyl)propionate hydroxylase
LLRPWNVEGAVTIERKAVYRFHARLASQWRTGRFLLAGDAAHQMPPFAGQGMCSGMRDAANLWWKLVDVINGHSAQATLDDYQAEREPNVRGIVEMAMLMGRTVCVADPDQAAARDAAMLADRAAGKSPDGATSYPPISAGKILAGSGGAGSYFPQPWSKDGLQTKLDDVTGAGPVLLTRFAQEAPHPCAVRVLETADPSLAFCIAELESWLDGHGVSAVLLRPDHYVFGSGDPKHLIDAWNGY